LIQALRLKSHQLDLLNHQLRPDLDAFVAQDLRRKSWASLVGAACVNLDAIAVDFDGIWIPGRSAASECKRK
jgi:hypothetical protein